MRHIYTTVMHPIFAIAAATHLHLVEPIPKKRDAPRMKWSNVKYVGTNTGKLFCK